jgi:hypothetical protein
MYRHPYDTMSSVRTAPRILLRLATVTAVAFALVAASVSAVPTQASASTPEATAAAGCVAQIQKGKKLVPVYQIYYKYAFKKVKVKGKKTRVYKRVVVKARRKLKVTCARQCVRTKVVKKKRVPVYKVVRKKVKVKKGNRIVTQRKKVRVYTFEKCKLPVGGSQSGSTVKVTLLPDSYATLDFGAFVRKASLTGLINGFIPGGYKLGQDAQIQLQKADLLLGQTDVFIDNDCQGGKVSAAIRTGNPTQVFFNPTKQSISTLTSAGGVTATAYVTVRLPLELRNDDDGCDQPYITTGYTEFDQTFFLKGKLGNGNTLTKLTLTSPPDPLDVQACLSRGLPTTPCNGFKVPLPIIVSTHLVVSIKIS